MIMFLPTLLILVFSAGSVTRTLAECDSQACLDYISRVDPISEFCNATVDALSCVNETLSTNSDCTPQVVKDTTQEIQGFQLLHACPQYPVPSGCEVLSCIKNVITDGDNSVICNTQAAVKCLDNTVIHTQSCSPIKEAVEHLKDYVEKVSQDYSCQGGAAGLMASVSLCVSLGSVAYFLTSVK